MSSSLDTNYKAEDFCIEVVLKDAASMFSAFSCGNSSIDDYFRNTATNDTNVCYAYRDLRNGSIVGAAAVCCSGINLSSGSTIQLIPVIKIDDFAISVDYQDTYFPDTIPDDSFHISDAFLCDLIAEMRILAEERIGARYLILYSVPDARHFYLRNFFEDFKSFMKPENFRYLDECVPMLLEI